MEETTVAIYDLASSVNSMSKNIEKMAREQEKQGERLGNLEKQPAERWNTMTRTIFTTVLSTIAGALASALLLMLTKVI